LFTYNLLNSRMVNLGPVATISIFETPFYGINGWLKRLEDIVLSVLILAIICIPMLAIAIAIKWTSPGPVLFKQRRYGLGGKSINIFKFRTMNVAENGDMVVQARKDDSRVTPFGKFLRCTSLDELPQFINVLLGDMSVVGPRPHAVVHNEEYRKLISGYMLRHKVKPGITGWAQINGFRGETDTLEKMEARVQYDLWYIRKWSIGLDLRIIARTVGSGFTGPNAY
jgi:putative colanic acid biosynthesis UDP-glucose lipid carrier transferase